MIGGWCRSPESRERTPERSTIPRGRRPITGLQPSSGACSLEPKLTRLGEFERGRAWRETFETRRTCHSHRRVQRRAARRAKGGTSAPHPPFGGRSCVPSMVA
jgi:hypothetical protein